MNPRFVPRIDKPCPLKWESMQGDDTKRFCTVCQLHVHNLSAMSAEESVQFLSQGKGRKCIAYVETPKREKRDVSHRRFLNRIFPVLRPAFAIMVASVSFLASGCATKAPSKKYTVGYLPPHTPTHTQASDQNAAVKEKLPEGKMIVGEFQRPLWKRILFFVPWQE